jgi:hypothetical protein
MPGFPAMMNVELPVRQQAQATESPPAATSVELDRIKIKNRRKRYLDLHPEYFGPQLELAGVQLSMLQLTSRN